VRQSLLLAGATVVLLVAVLVLFLNAALTAPVRELVAVMRRAETGDLGARAAEARADEVGELARGLNRMLARVGSFQAELARQVAEATAELRRVNQRLSAAQQAIGRNERLAAAGELAAAMAHDVGTPLTAVSGHLQLLEEQVEDAGVRRRVHTIHAQVERAVAAARRFLDSARPASRRAPVDLNSLLGELLLLVTPEGERKGVSIALEVTPGLPMIEADAGQMQELFLNLLANALEATPKGGIIQVATSAMDGGLRVSVRDPGAGMTAEVRARAFEPFFTTHSASGGTGLGLAICRRIVEAHGGTIRLESQAGRGTEVVVELPEKGHA
jgi:signal transduction histidine kinase